MTEPKTERPPRTVAQRLRRQRTEYSGWVAVEEIRLGNGALAYAPGYPVPESNVVDGRVILGRHQCDGDPGCGDSPNDRCDQFNAPTEMSEEGLVQRVGSNG